MEELLEFKDDAKITVLKCKVCHFGDEPDEQCYQVVLSWDHGKHKTKDGTPYNYFIESWGTTVDGCVKQLKEDIKQI